MTPADLTFARRAVACAGWRWVPGMRGIDMDGHAFITIEADILGPRWFAYLDGRSRTGATCGALPDLDDDATLGCLRRLVREARKDPFFGVVGVAGRGWRWPEGDGWSATYWSEAAALVAALGAACQE